jgi:hypothetical protein
MLILLGLVAWPTARAANLSLLVDLFGAPSTGTPSAMEGGSGSATNRQRVIDTAEHPATPVAPVGGQTTGERGTDLAPQDVAADVGKPVSEPRRPARRGAKLRTLLPGSIR